MIVAVISNFSSVARFVELGRHPYRSVDNHHSVRLEPASAVVLVSVKINRHLKMIDFVVWIESLQQSYRWRCSPSSFGRWSCQSLKVVRVNTSHSVAHLSEGGRGQTPGSSLGWLGHTVDKTIIRNQRRFSTTHSNASQRDHCLARCSCRLRRSMNDQASTLMLRCGWSHGSLSVSSRLIVVPARHRLQWQHRLACCRCIVAVHFGCLRPRNSSILTPLNTMRG